MEMRPELHQVLDGVLAPNVSPLGALPLRPVVEMLECNDVDALLFRIRDNRACDLGCVVFGHVHGQAPLLPAAALAMLFPESPHAVQQALLLFGIGTEIDELSGQNRPICAHHAAAGIDMRAERDRMYLPLGKRLLLWKIRLPRDHEPQSQPFPIPAQDRGRCLVTLPMSGQVLRILMPEIDILPAPVPAHRTISI